MIRRAVVIAGLFAAAGLLPVTAGPRVSASQGIVFSSGVETVRVDVSVRRDGEAVRGLTAADFEVVDNGVPQTVDLVGFEDVPVNVVLTLDMSGSVQGARLAQLQQGGARLVDALEPRDRAALVTFTDLVQVRSGLTADTRQLTAALRQPAQGADTSLIDATHAAMVLGESETGRPLVIVFSDGADTASFLSADLALNTARRTGSVVYAVTTPQAEQSTFLDNLVRATGGRRLSITSLDRLSDAFAEIIEESRQRYLLSYTPRDVASDGWHDLTVRVRGRRADVRARPGYLAGP